MGSHYTKGQKQKAEQLRGEGWSFRKIVELVGGSRDGWRCYLNSLNIPKGGVHSETAPTQISEHYFRNGKSKAGTARHFGVGADTVSKMLILAGHPKEASPSIASRVLGQTFLPPPPHSSGDNPLPYNGYIRQFAQEILALLDNEEKKKIAIEELQVELAALSEKYNLYKLEVQETLARLR